jgi:hypothetical protein
MSKRSGNENYGKGRRKPSGSKVRVNQYWGLDPNDLPQPGDWVRLATRAHLLTKVTPSKTHPDTISYEARIFPLDMIPPGDRVYDSESNLKLMGY